jgi:hypothetical protein
MVQGVHSQWKRDYCLEQKRRLFQHQRDTSRTADGKNQINGTIPALSVKEGKDNIISTPETAHFYFKEED